VSPQHRRNSHESRRSKAVATVDARRSLPATPARLPTPSPFVMLERRLGKLECTQSKLARIGTTPNEVYRSDEQYLADFVERELGDLAEVQRVYAELARPATEDEISLHLTLMMGNFGGAGGNRQLQVLGETLPADIGDEQPTLLALEWATRKIRIRWSLRDNFGHMPAAADVIRVLKKATYFAGEDSKDLLTDLAGTPEREIEGAKFRAIPGAIERAQKRLEFRKQQYDPEREAHRSLYRYWKSRNSTAPDQFSSEEVGREFSKLCSDLSDYHFASYGDENRWRDWWLPDPKPPWAKRKKRKDANDDDGDDDE
jgi:hypothetical protein